MEGISAKKRMKIWRTLTLDSNIKWAIQGLFAFGILNCIGLKTADGEELRFFICAEEYVYLLLVLIFTLCRRSVIKGRMKNDYSVQVANRSIITAYHYVYRKLEKDNGSILLSATYFIVLT